MAPAKTTTPDQPEPEQVGTPLDLPELDAKADAADDSAASFDVTAEPVELASYGFGPKEIALAQAVQLYARVNATPLAVVQAAEQFETYLTAE